MRLGPDALRLWLDPPSIDFTVPDGSEGIDRAALSLLQLSLHFYGVSARDRLPKSAVSMSRFQMIFGASRPIGPTFGMWP